MSPGQVLRLFPPPAAEVQLVGLYLREFPACRGRDERPFVYTNFIASLDGRISQPDPNTGLRRVPPAIANARDLRLYGELMAGADALLTTAQHLRAVAAGRHRELLAIPEGGADVLAWRLEHGLPREIPCVAVSRSLDIPAQALIARHPGPIVIVTGADAGRERIEALEAAGIEVVVAGAGPRLTGRELIMALAKRGHRCIYSIAGPRILHALLEADFLDRIYLTTAQVMLGGDGDTLLHGPALAPPRGFGLRTLYFDPQAPSGAGQLFASFDRAAAAG